MTQPQRGPTHGEVDDLRNIVERLDLLMGSADAPAWSSGARSGPDRAIVALTERVSGLEHQVEELRTLVNHLMTIATWQAKVTATLVDDRAPEDAAGHPAREGDAQPPSPPTPPAHAADTAGVDPPSAREPARPHHDAGSRATTTLDDDIDEILGTDRSGPRRDGPPPDFGI